MTPGLVVSNQRSGGSNKYIYALETTESWGNPGGVSLSASIQAGCTDRTQRQFAGGRAASCTDELRAGARLLEAVGVVTPRATFRLSDKHGNSSGRGDCGRTCLYKRTRRRAGGHETRQLELGERPHPLSSFGVLGGVRKSPRLSSRGRGGLGEFAPPLEERVGISSRTPPLLE
jgi:hypothetical protein